MEVRPEPGRPEPRGPRAGGDLTVEREGTLGAQIPGAGAMGEMGPARRYLTYPGSTSHPGEGEILRSTTAEVAEVSSSMEESPGELGSPRATGRGVAVVAETEAP